MKKKIDRRGRSGRTQRVIDSVNAEVASEIARTIDYFKTTSRRKRHCASAAVWRGGKNQGLTQQLRDRMHVDVEIANPFNEIDTPQCGVDPDFW